MTGVPNLPIAAIESTPAPTSGPRPIAENRLVLEAWGDLIDPRDYIATDYDSGYNSGSFVSDRVGNRERGEDYPIFRTENDLAMIRAMGDFFAKRSAGGVGPLSTLSNYVFSKGFAITAQAAERVVAPDELPSTAVPGTLARFDLENLKVAEVFEYTNGSFPSPPTFVPRVGSTEANDGYVVVIVHQDGPKEIQIFDAANVGVGPVARATSADFNPNLMLHSWWMDPATAPKKVNYRVSVWAESTSGREKTRPATTDPGRTE